MNLLDANILKDSSSYQLLEEKVRGLVEGKIRVEEARSILLALPSDRLGPPSDPQKELVNGIDHHDRLIRLCMNVGTLATWNELLASEPAD